MWQIAEFADETKRECEIETSIKNEVLTEQMITDLGLRIHRVYEG